MSAERQGTAVRLELPAWIVEFVDRHGRACVDVESRMAVVLDLVATQVAQRTGGPFAAAVFDLDDGRMVAAGVNVVEPSCTSVAHAEIMALALAGQRLGTHDLSGAGRYELVTSTEPCAMCLGAIPWSGVVSVVAGARDEDARSIGFDEGTKPSDWADSLEKRGITVTRDVSRSEARSILEDYAADGGSIYNGGIRDTGRTAVER